jgi:hypothetical protein
MRAHTHTALGTGHPHEFKNELFCVEVHFAPFLFAAQRLRLPWCRTLIPALNRCQVLFMTAISMTPVSCCSRWTRQNCCPNAQHQCAIWKSSTAAAEKTRLVARKTSGTCRAALDVHRTYRARETKHLTRQCGENRPSVEDHAGKTTQRCSLRRDE